MGRAPDEHEAGVDVTVSIRLLEGPGAKRSRTSLGIPGYRYERRFTALAPEKASSSSALGAGRCAGPCDDARALVDVKRLFGL